MADVQFDEAKARAWGTEVESELEQVEVLLKQVAEECATQPYEDDTIMNELHKTGIALDNAWKELGKQFSETISGMYKAFDVISDFVNKTIERIANWTRSARN